MTRFKIAASQRPMGRPAAVPSATGPNCLSLRVGLAMSAAAGALFLAAPGAALAQIVPPSPPECTAAGAVVTCTGNLTAGVSITNDPPVFNELVVNTSTLISPAPGTDGILFTSGQNVKVDSTADITVSGANADGIEAQTAYGGYGRPGGNVVIDSTGTIVSGSGRGIYASAGDTLTPFSASVTNYGAITAFKEGIHAKSSTGTVTVDSTGKITSQDTGIRAEIPGYNIFNTTGNAIRIENNGDIEATSFGIFANANGGIVIESTGKITTDEENFSNDGDGIVARSFADKTNATSSVNDITITNTGDIQASASGNGILVYSAYSDDAKLSVTHVSGTITGGDGNDDPNAIEVFTIVKSLNLPVDGTVTVNVTTSGALKGGGQYGAGINLLLYSYNFGAKMDAKVVIGSTGSVEGGSGIDGIAIRAYKTVSPGCGCDDGDQTQNVTVENSGTVTGSVDLGSYQQSVDAISFENKSGGVFNMGSFVYLGDGNDLTNAGKLSPGGDGKMATTTVTGNLVQLAGGTMLIDVNGDTNTADRINVSGTANLAGTVTVNVINPVSTDQQFTILSAVDGVTDSGLTLAGGLPVGFSLLYPNPNDLVLGVTVDFSLDEGDLNRNQTALAKNLNAIIDAGAGDVAPVTNALLDITDLDQYRDALNQLLPEHYLNLQAATLFAAEDFAQSLMSCREREGAYAVIAEGQCIWAEADMNRFDQDGTSEQMQTEEDSYRFAAGGQFGLSEQWHMGFAFRYETLEQDTGDSATSDGQRAHAGAALKYNQGPLLLAGAVSAGRSWYDTERNFGFGGFSDSASSSHEVDYLNGLLRGALLMPLGDYYLKPIADLNVTHVSADGFTEKDGGGAGLDVDDADGTHVSFSPALEAGAEWRLSSGTLLRPFIGGGVTWYGDNDFTGTASFADGPEEAGSFVTRTEIDEVMGEVAAGIDILGTGGFDLRLRYEGAFGETVTSQSLGLRAAMRF